MRKTFYLAAVLHLLSCTIKAQGWSELGGLSTLGANGQINGVCTDVSGNIYAAGLFTNGSGKEYVAKYNGSTWSELGGTNALAANFHIQCVCSDPSGNIYAAGQFTNGATNGSGNFYVAKYNGTTWSELGGTGSLPANGSILSVCSDISGNIYAAGYFTNGSGKFYVAKYNGTTWGELGGANALSANHYINGICADASGNIYAGGDFMNGSSKYYVAKYNGSAWSELGGANTLAANDIIFSVCSDASGNIYAAGNFTNASGNQYVAKYDGSTWTELGGLNALSANGQILTLCADAPGNIYAAGVFINNPANSYVAKFNGTNWSELGGVNALAANNEIVSICSDAARNIYAGGAFTNVPGKNYVAKYSATACQGDSSMVSDTICQGDVFHLGGNAYTQAGTYTAHLTNAGGCDSMVKLTLAVRPAPAVSFSWEAMVHDSLFTVASPGDTIANCKLRAISLLGGTPAGGFYSGSYVRNDTFFNPLVFFGDSISYTYTGANGCSKTVTHYFPHSECLTGIAGLNAAVDFALYPNPAGEFTHLDFDQTLTGAIVHLRDITGRELFTGKLTSSPQLLSTVSLAPGIYWVSVEMNGQISVKLLNKE